MWFAGYIGIYSQTVYPLNTVALQNGLTGACQSLNSPRYYIGAWYSLFSEPSFCQNRLNFLYSGYSVATSMFAGFDGFRFYSTGVLSTQCPFTTVVDHAVLMVGFYFDNTITNMNSPTNYILFKNSWGTAWGENGYFRISPYNNRCNVCSRSEASV
jgi:hypothetical protein